MGAVSEVALTTYSQRVRENILPLSVASTLPEAFEEWTFTGATEDHGQPCEDCQLCDHEELRYWFEIRNRYTSHALWIGSQCILKFNVPVYEGSRRLTKAEATRKLRKLTEHMRLEACLAALERLAGAEANDILTNALAYYRENKRLSPKLAFVVLWRLQKHRIDHSPSFFKVSLKRERHQSDLREMSASKVRTLWPALSASQRVLAKRLGHRDAEDA